MKRRTVLRTLLAAMLIGTTATFAAGTAQVKGNPDSKIYHKSTCKYYAAKGSTETFETEAAAKKAGFTVCKKCGKAKKAASTAQKSDTKTTQQK